LKDCNEVVDCSGRREFLVKAAFMAGGLALTLSGAGKLLGNTLEDVVVNIDDKSPLKKVGGSTVVSGPAGKIIVVRTGETDFVAYAAACTHKGTTIEYDAAKKQFTCPNHGSTFDAGTGARTGGPAKVDLPSYKATGTATSVTVKTS
jgi:cytochrome b6-f complex iron-sulfur subunit